MNDTEGTDRRLYSVPICAGPLLLQRFGAGLVLVLIGADCKRIHFRAMTVCLSSIENGSMCNQKVIGRIFRAFERFIMILPSAIVWVLHCCSPAARHADTRLEPTNDGHEVLTNEARLSANPELTNAFWVLGKPHPNPWRHQGSPAKQSRKPI